MKRYIRSSKIATENLAHNSKDPKVLAQLANDEDEDVRWYVADNPNTPADILAQLANDEDAYVRESVATNRITPADVLAQLANDEDEGVRYRVAQNTSTPADVLAQLANDEDIDVRREVADNPNCPVGLKKSKKSKKWPSADKWYNIESDEEFEDMWSTYLAGPEDKVNKQLQIFPEPSVQGSVGEMFIFDESENENGSFSIDFQDWCDQELSMAAESKNATEYKKKYRDFVESLISENWE